MEPVTSARGSLGKDFWEDYKEATIGLTYSTTSDISRVKHTLGALVVCIIQVVRSYALLKSGIVKGTGFPKFTVEKLGLRFGWVQAVLVRETHLLLSLLSFDVLSDHSFTHRTDRACIVTAAPQSRQTGTEERILFAEHSRRESLQSVDDFGNTQS